ncbi:MAG: hypothetical protein DRO40_00780 [Thermoprotei archaeon]|nr:MAG: hypothetical protein DRO40_00780 [Thermoprotei archaeon]
MNTLFLGSVIEYENIIWIYRLQNIAALVILLLIVSTLFIEAKIGKIITTILSTMFIVIHYYIILMVSNYIHVTIYPLVIIELWKSGGTITIDLGQILIIFTVILWRKELANVLRRRSKPYKQDIR